MRPKPDAAVVAMVFPPWWSGSEALSAVAATHAAIIRTGIIPTILVIRPAADDGLALLYKAGALLAIDPLALGGCLARPTTR